MSRNFGADEDFENKVKRINNLGILKFKLSPKGMRKIVYRLHTTSATFLIMILLLVVGHLIVD